MTFQSLGRSITSHLGLFACGSIISGVVIGNNFRPESLRLLIPVALFMMLYPMMLDIELGDMGETLKRPGLLGIALIVNFALSPLIMIVVSYVFKLTALPSLVV